jgi:hypothetical protein
MVEALSGYIFSLKTFVPFYGGTSERSAVATDSNTGWYKVELQRGRQFVEEREKLQHVIVQCTRSDCSSYCSFQVQLPTAVYPIPIVHKKTCIDR